MVCVFVHSSGMSLLLWKTGVACVVMLPLLGMRSRVLVCRCLCLALRVAGLLSTFLSLRDVSVDVVEAVVAWRWHESSGSAPGVPLPVFYWNGVDYLHKMCNDLDFLSNCEPLVR